MFLLILIKEGSEISIEVSNIIKRAYVLIIDLDRFGEYKEPEYNLAEKIHSWENKLESIENHYYSLSEEFLRKFCINKVKQSFKPCYNY